MSGYSHPPLYIAFEGLEGAGKTTMIDEISSLLRRTGYDVEVVHEPGGTPIAEALRTLVKSKDYDEHFHPLTELLIFSGARYQLLENRVKPALAAGKIVISDRTYLSSMAYQGYGGGMNSQCELLTDLVVGDLRPDLTIYMDLDPEIGLARVGKRGPTDRIEENDAAYFVRVRSRFQVEAKHNPKVKQINASGTRAENFVQCWGLINNLLAETEVALVKTIE